MLYSIKESVKLIGEAIASVVAIDVTIVDDKLVRISGTGRYKQSVGEKVSDSSAFCYALKNNVGFIIENPGEHQACEACECKFKCSEHAEVCQPIRLKDQVIGVIGLIAFEPDQRDNLIKNQDHLLAFLERMAELISSKVMENKQAEINALLASELKTVFNVVSTALIVTDEKGEVTKANAKAMKLFHMAEAGESLGDFLEERDFKSLIKGREKAQNIKLKLKHGTSGYMDHTPLKVDQSVVGHVLTFRPMSEVLETANDLMHDGVSTTFDAIYAESKEMLAIKAFADKMAKTPSTILILGESGTGKELFARAIHAASHRHDRPFIAINCSAIPEPLLESELFGYEEGAFTGAKKGGKWGKFQLANKGTLFLDEIGDMPLHLQSKLLRVLQDGAIEPIGGQLPVKVDVRLIAATHQNLEEKVEEGSFRKDLFYRLNVIPLNIPPLRERKGDIKSIVWAMTNKFNSRLNKQIGSIESECFDILMAYSWPGNVRELENAMEYAVNMCETTTLQKQDLPKRILNQHEPQSSQEVFLQDQVSLAKSEETDLLMPLKELEKNAILRALSHFKGDKEAAAQALGISRATLYRKLSDIKQKGDYI